MGEDPGGTGPERAPGPRHGRDETPEERADRRWAELLQEVRVAQTGVQILLGFLLSVAFTPRFARLGDFDRRVYLVTVVLGATATGALIAPVSFHRMLSGRRLKPELVQMAARLTGLGVVLLALTVGSSLLLLLHVATGRAAAVWTTAAVMVWFAVCWLLVPYWIRWRGERPESRRPPGE
ncbi:DUF6328 family protein [Streptacidiphilus sp. ASG 303]|uniref:DUF6328 family protein n=1 Tax=Streptacidiphilus sp. ASG 303 TaxID=2896847 RepID=UPI001E3F41AC|nr:DUF6328 family protein [Streptacidiphilus sp. ASG 303]MCD0480931.1 DUF6328 family protein [Streptacidiphilus sp. ASG 303]